MKSIKLLSLKVIFKLGVLLIFRAPFSSGADGFSLTGSCQKLKKTLELSSELNSLAKQRNLIGTMTIWHICIKERRDYENKKH